MKIAYFLTHPIQYQSPLIRAVRDAGVDVHVIYGPMAADWGASDPELGRQEPWDVPLLEGYPHEFVESPFAFGPAGLFCLHPRIKRLLQRLRPEAVWIHGWGDVFSVAAWNAARQLGIPVLLRGESHLKCLKGGFIRRWLHRQILTRCFGTVTRFLVIGSANREFYRSYGVPAAKIVDVPYAVDNERFSHADATLPAEIAGWREKLGIGEGDTVIGFFGKLKQVKRPDLALRGVARAAAGLSPEKRPWLLLVGDGPWRAKMELLAKQLYPARTRFLGFQNQSRLPALYRLTDLLLLPSDLEPWGLVVNEAMCAGRAAVVSDRVGSGPDLVKDTGQVFPAGSATRLAEVLHPMLQDRDLIKEAGRCAAQRIETWSFREDATGLKAALQELPPVEDAAEVTQVRRGVVAAYLGVHQVFQMGAAAAEDGRLEHFYCSLIRFPHRWGDLLARWLFIPSASPLGSEVMPPDRVSETPLPLLAQRLAERCVAPRRLDPLYTNRWFASQVARHLPEHPAAGIFVGAETCALELLVAAKKLGMRCLLDCHGIPTDFLQAGISRAAQEFGLEVPRLLDSPAMAEHKRLERELADVLVLCSELQRQVYLEHGVPPEKLRVVPLWVDTGFWHPPVKRDERAGDRPLRVLHAGAGSLAKGLPYLLAALDQVPAPGVEMTLVGPVQPDMKPFLKNTRCKIQRLSYCPRAELREQYWNHDVLVMASLGDSFGFVAVEAMACGLPVIVTDRCGAPVPDPAWRVPAFSAAGIAARLEYYARDRRRLRHDGRTASDFARQLTSDRYRKSIRQIYDELQPTGLPA
ncbi:MAG: glycosyltransferase family 4 protein [Verrucomicrobiales bacterium]|nr:glycosyltransferase family 4 protein [Verrucomicrobiales bacterium]